MLAMLYLLTLGWTNVDQIYLDVYGDDPRAGFM